jgi:hypothetical protein
VTAISKDGERASTTVHYNVAAPPIATISSPPSGETYVVGQNVRTTFSCQDGKGGPGIASCLDGDASSAPHGRLNTTRPGAHTYTVAAISKDGQRATAMISYRIVKPPPGPVKPPPAPRLSELKIAPRSFQAATKGPTVGGNSDTGATIHYRDTLAGHARLVVLRCAGKHGGCTKLARVGSFGHRDHRGANRLHFTGRLLGRALSAGRYRLRVTATLNGQRSHMLTVKFMVMPSPPTCQDHDHDGDCDAPGQI